MIVMEKIQLYLRNNLGHAEYQFESQRVQQNDQQEASPEPYDNNSDCLGNRLVFNHFAIKLHI